MKNVGVKVSSVLTFRPRYFTIPRLDMSGKAANSIKHRSMKSAGEMDDDGGAWTNEGAKVAEFLTWFTSEPEAEAPLKNMVMISSSST